MSYAQGIVLQVAGAVRCVRPRMSGWQVLPLLSLLLFAQSAFGAEAHAPRECQIKAAFLYNFTKFVEWPPQSFLRPSDPIVIGVLGAGSMTADILEVVKHRKVGGRGLVVRRVETPAEARSTRPLCSGCPWRLIMHRCSFSLDEEESRAEALEPRP